MPREPVLRNTCHGPPADIPPAACLPLHRSRPAEYQHKPSNPTPSVRRTDKEYRCIDLKTGYVTGYAESSDQTPNDYCFNVLQSRTHCPRGEYLCQFQRNPGWQMFLRLLYAWRFAHTDSNSDSWKEFMRSYGVLPKRSNEIHRRDHKLCDILLPYRDGCQRFNHAKIGERAAHLKPGV